MLLAFSKQLILYWRYLRMTMKLPIAKDYTPIIGHLLEFAGPRKYLQEKCDSFVLKNNTRAPFVAWMGPIPLLYLFRPEHVEQSFLRCRVTDDLMDRMMQPWLYPDFAFKFTSKGRRMANCLKVLHGMTNKVRLCNPFTE
ncbi:hypothetical protein C0J52_06761 [Blattella germanica]|nr:hypothetical protein C0J52_06761 [Blattella germanica]